MLILILQHFHLIQYPLTAKKKEQFSYNCSFNNRMLMRSTFTVVVFYERCLIPPASYAGLSEHPACLTCSGENGNFTLEKNGIIVLRLKLSVPSSLLREYKGAIMQPRKRVSV